MDRNKLYNIYENYFSRRTKLFTKHIMNPIYKDIMGHQKSTLILGHPVRNLQNREPRNFSLNREVKKSFLPVGTSFSPNTTIETTNDTDKAGNRLSNSTTPSGEGIL